MRAAAEPQRPNEDFAFSPAGSMSSLGMRHHRAFELREPHAALIRERENAISVTCRLCPNQRGITDETVFAGNRPAVADIYRSCLLPHPRSRQSHD